MTPELSIIVPNWNGSEWLSRCLSSLQISAQLAARPHEIIVVDDASSDDSVPMIRSRFPRVRIIRNRANRGFARSVNRGVSETTGRYLILCNNDLTVRESFIGELLKPFDAPLGESVFAVSARTQGWYDGKPNQLCMAALWRGGRLTPAWSDPPQPAPCLFVQAGAAAYRRSVWQQLGGLSYLYEPGYWEDYDLSWRAAKAGWQQVYNPHAFALHVGGGSMSRRYGRARVEAMKARNHLLFEAANLTAPRLLAEWAARVPLHANRSTNFSRALMGALPRLPQALRQRTTLRREVDDFTLLAPYRAFTASF